jgi:transcriptional regulator with XRE-family HTH domain
MRSKIIKKILDETSEETKIFVSIYSDLIVLINSILREKGYSQKMLADNLGKQPSEINKWLSGDHNFTLRSICKLQAELCETLLVVPKRPSISDFKQRGNMVTYKVTVQREEIARRKAQEEWYPSAKIEQLANVG